MKKLAPVLSELKAIPGRGVVIGAEEAIVRHLLDFESICPSPKKLSDEDFAQIERVLIHVLNTNNGTLCFQCCIRVAACLTKLYSGSRQSQIWNLITAFNKHPKPSIVLALGSVLKTVGKSCKSTVNGIATSLLGLNDKMAFCQIFALCACVKSSAKDVEPLSEKIFNLAKKLVMDKTNEPLQLLCLKLMRKMIKGRILTSDKVEPVLKQLLEGQIMPYIIDESCFLIATMAMSCIRSVIAREGDVDDTEYAKANFEKQRKARASDVKKALETLGRFKDQYMVAFPRFLSLLTPQFIYMVRRELFDYVRKVMPKALPQLIAFLGMDVRKELFTELSKEKPTVELLSTLSSLSFDVHTSTEAAGLAMQLASRQKNKTRSEGCEFYTGLACGDLEMATSFVRTSSLFLATPPEGSPTIARDMRGMALICASILAASPERKELIEMAEANLVKFLKTAFTCQSALDWMYQPAFIIMAALPKRYVVKEEIDRMLSLYPQYLLKNEVMTPKQMKVATMVGDTLALFISVHSDFESTFPIVDCFFNNPFLLTDVVQVALFQVYARLKVDNREKTSIAEKLKKVVLKGNPDPEYGISRIKFPFMTRTRQLRTSEYSPKPIYKVFVYLSSHDIGERVIRSIPDFIMGIPEESRPRWMKWLVSNTERPFMTFNCILSLLEDERTRRYLSHTVCDIILSHMESIPRVDQLQIAAECIGKKLSLSPARLEPFLKSIAQRKDRIKCLIYAAICAHCQLTNDQIGSFLLELNELAKIPEFTPYALHGLASLFTKFPAQLASLPYMDVQANFLLSILCSPQSLDPFVLFHLAHSFRPLLPILARDIDTERQMSVPVIKMIIQLIAATSLPFCQQSFFYAVHAMFSFTSQLVQTVKMVFPKTRGHSLSCQIEACQAFADMLVVTDTREDYFSLVPHVLMLLQRTEHRSARNFILAVATNFAKNAQDSIAEQTIRDRILEWTRLIKFCLSSGNLPNTGNTKIAASLPVKLCLLSACKPLLPLIALSDPLLTEALDDVITTLTRAIESRNTKMQKLAFPVMSRVIELFKAHKNDEGSKLLGLYDMQFSVAVKHGFSCLNVASDFIIKYVEFELDGIDDHIETFMPLVTIFVTGLTECQCKVYSYYFMASKLCLLAGKYTSVYEAIEPLLERFVKEFSSIVFSAGRIWNSDEPNDEEVNKFRTEFSPFFDVFLTSFVWLQALLKEEIVKLRQFVDFIIGEVSEKNNEDWRIKAAFQGMTSLMHYYPSETKLTPRMVQKMIHAVSESYEIHSDLLKPTMKEFLLEASERISQEDKTAWNELISLFVDDNFHPTVLCYLIRNGEPKKISKYTKNFFDIIYQNFLSDQCSEAQAVALNTMLFYVASDQVSNLLSYVLSIKDKHNDKIIHFKFAFISKILAFSSDSLLTKHLKNLSRFLWANFDKGGLDLAVQLVMGFREIGRSIIVCDLISTYTNDCCDRIESVHNFIEFAHFALQQFDVSEEDLDAFVNNAIRFVLRAIIQWGDDRIHAVDVITRSAQLLNVINGTSAPLIRVVFKSMGEEFQQMAIDYVERHVMRRNRKTSGVNLQFGSGQTKRRKVADDSSDDEGWQDL